MKKLSRRAFLWQAGLGAAALLAHPDRVFASTQGVQPAGRMTSLPRQMDPMMPDAEVNISAAEKWVQILPGAQTRVFGYEGTLVSGTGVQVVNLPGSYLGPILRVRKGTQLRMNFYNNLPAGQPSIIHPHGLRVPQDCDGQPMDAIDPGLVKQYNFQVIDRACPAWFHPHPMMLTAEQVAMGLAGLFYVNDAEEDLAVPGAATGENDVPLVIQDRAFDANNQILYTPNQMWGYLGDRILVNGKLNATFSFEPRAYRLRVINGSNARTYKLAWSNGMALTVIGTDGGLLPVAVTKSYVLLMPGERVDLWADFSKLGGKQVILRSLSFSPGGGMMGGGGMGGGGMGGGGTGMALANGAQFNILTVNVGRKAGTKPVLGTLPPLEVKFNAGNVKNFSAPVPFTLDMRMMVWTINGRVYNMDDMMEVAEDEMAHIDEPIAWEWINNSPIPHPMHIHNVQFQVVQRLSPATTSYGTISQGLVDSGWKDTVTVWPGERVKIAMKFSPHAGMYMYHCHILEHEDMGMMRNLMVMDEMMP